MTTKHDSLLRLLSFLFLLVAVCVGVSALTAKWVMWVQEWEHDQPHGHAWLQKELGLTDEERRQIDEFEAQYRSHRSELLDRFERKIAGLAEILETNDSYSPEVIQAVHQLHEVHGKLQNLSIEHYYDMFGVLPSEKRAKLRDLAIEALSEPE